MHIAPVLDLNLAIDQSVVLSPTPEFQPILEVEVVLTLHLAIVVSLALSFL